VAAVRVALDEGLVVALHAAAPTAFGGALWLGTGAERHLEQVAAAHARGRRGAAPALPLEVPDEAEVYAAARLPVIPPELREGRGEVEAAREGRLLRLVDAEEIEGDLRVQSDWAGGAHPPERLAAAAAGAGHRWLALVDPLAGPHRPSGLDAERAARRAASLAAFHASAGSACRLLAGVEVPIGDAGHLEGDPALLDAADLRVGVLDPGGPLAARSRAERTAAVVRALLGGATDVLALAPDPSPARGMQPPPVGLAALEAGATGGEAAPPGPRPLAAWLDLGAILAAAASARVALLVPAHAAGGLLGPADLRRAAALGVPLALGTGARAVQELSSMEVGVALVRRAGLGPGALLNARSEADLRTWLAARRR
jgi:DNA polymerase (family 10)